MGMKDLHRQRPKDDPREADALGTRLGNWDESKHPRDGGKFAPSDGGDATDRALEHKEKLRPAVKEMMDSPPEKGLELARSMSPEEASRALDVIYEDLPLEEDTPITEALRETLRVADEKGGKGHGTEDESPGSHEEWKKKHGDDKPVLDDEGPDTPPLQDYSGSHEEWREKHGQRRTTIEPEEEAPVLREDAGSYEEWRRERGQRPKTIDPEK